MGFLYPGALAFFALIPLLLIAYLVRERPRSVLVSSVLGYRALRGLRAERPWGWPRLDWLFLMELLILSLVVLAMAQPFVIHRHTPVAVVLDNSAAMQAGTPPGARFEAAKAALERAIPNQSDVAVALYLTAPQPHQVGDAMSPSRARSAIGKARTVDAAQSPVSVARMLRDIVSGHGFTQCFFATANPVSQPLPVGLHVFRAGDPLPNYAIGSFAVGGAQFGSGALKARLTIANFSSQPQSLEVAISAEGKTLTRAQARLQAQEITGIEFPTLAPSTAYRADLKPADAFALDNTAFATPATGAQIQVLFVSPTPADAAGLASLPQLGIRTLSPDDYSPAAAKADLLIFEYGIPKELPAANALLVIPPGGDDVFGLRLVPGTTTQITDWRSPDPLTDGVNFRLLSLRQPESFAVHPWMHSVVNSNLGALIMEGQHQGHRYVVLGFNPFPYLGTRNLPMSVLTLNILGYLSGFGSEDAGYRTGEPWIVPAGVSEIIMPSGNRVRVEPGIPFAKGTEQGIYQLIGPGSQRRLRAVNLADLNQSNLENPATIKLDIAAGGGGHPADFSERQTFTPYLLAAILILAACEALFTYRRRRVYAQGLT
ncbi:MAG TPA: BatA and WFA domain-containing protein [Candidatus Binataceae bacterium]|nr:BatA and WFA domain-containing protein [Candidatus Binataceae bacterium]